MKKKVLSLTGVLLAAAVTLSACGGSSSKYDSAYSVEAPAAAPEASWDYYEDYSNGSYDSFGTDSKADSVSESGAESTKDTSRKLIKTVDIDVETKDFDTLVETLESQVVNYGGYVEYSNTYNGSRYGSYIPTRSSDYTIRIPQDKLAAFLDSFSALCNVTNKNERVEDITLTYVDLESHKLALLAEQDRLLDLLDSAYDLNDILIIESRLTDIRYQLQSMESQLRTYDNKVTYSTVYINIQEVRELTIVEPEPETFWERVSKGFADSLASVGEGLTNFAVWFLTALPHLLLWGAIIFGIVMLIRGIVRHNVKKNKIRRQQMEAENAKRAAAMPPVMPMPGMVPAPGMMPNVMPNQPVPSQPFVTNAPMMQNTYQETVKPADIEEVKKDDENN